MSFASPEEIAARAKNAYPRFLKQWVRGEDERFFPYRVRVRLAVDPEDPSGTIAASEKLLLNSKTHRGWGYTVHREQVRTRQFGRNPIPKAITIDTIDDLLRLAGKRDEFAATRRVVNHVRKEIPQLQQWLVTHVNSLEKIAEPIEDLVHVSRYFVDNPWPDCYARQIPVSVDTKFVDRHKGVLRQWLDLLLPASAIDVNESTFALRFGLRDDQSHHAMRMLDPHLLVELDLPYDEMSLPLRSIAALPVNSATVLIVENRLNLLTLPPTPRGIGLRGEGNAVARLERIKWLHDNRVLYWGDIDVDGFLILSRLRNLFPHVESIMMDRDTMAHHERYVVEGNGSTPAAPANLTAAEADAFAFCSQDNCRLEQEKIGQPFVDRTMAEWIATSVRLAPTS